MESWEQERKIGTEWYEYASKENDNYFVKFMMYWVAFNWLYEEYRKDSQDTQNSQETKNTKNTKNTKDCNDRPDEKLAIQNFLDGNNNKENLKALESLKIFKKPEFQDAIAVLTKEPIIDARTGIPKGHYKYEVVNNESILDLIYIIYHIRCNLFHGSKSPSSDRNRDLVIASATILDAFLKKLLRI